MKKLFALLSLFAFLAVSVNAQTPVTKTSGIKAETAAKADVKSATKATPACCAHTNAACCKNKDPKACTASEKAACAKAGKTCDHSKTEASDVKEPKSDMK